MAWRARLLAAIGLVAGAGPAQATANLDCGAKDASVAFTARSLQSRGLGGGLVQFEAELALKAKGVPADLARLAFTGDHLVHRWVVGGEANLLLYREREGDAPHGYVEVVLRTRMTPDGTRGPGSYEITVHEAGGEARPEGVTRRFRGRAGCSVG